MGWKQKVSVAPFEGVLARWQRALRRAILWFGLLILRSQARERNSWWPERGTNLCPQSYQKLTASGISCDPTVPE